MLFYWHLQKKGDYLANKSTYNLFKPLFFEFYQRISDGSKHAHLLNLQEAINLEDIFFNENLRRKLEMVLADIGGHEFPYKERMIDKLNDIEKLIEFNEDQQHKYFNITGALLNSEFNLVSFQEKLANLIDGKVYYDSTKKELMFRQHDKEYSLKNTASGVKQICIIQMLLENRVLSEGSFLFIDEPEINIHPEWQIKLAEILVLMVKELDIRMYINSHSPQFVEAIEVYSGKYCLAHESAFYLSVDVEDNKFTFKEIPRENLYELYDNLGSPYDVLDEIRSENIANGIF